MDPSLARVAVDPIASWMPPIVTTVLMLGFAFAWWRAQRKAEFERTAREDIRYGLLQNSMSGLTSAITEMRVALTGFVTVDRHTQSMTTLHEKINEHGKQIAVLLDRNARE